jgi:gluconate 2-dehydrogenase gamma chain
MTDLHDRRAFLRAAAAAGVAWAAADLLQVEDALAWAAQSAASTDAAGTTVLTKDQADTIDAVASRILPAVDGRPGAHEAGAVYFIDRALSTFNADQRKLYVDGIADLNRRAVRKWKASGFVALTNDKQDAVLRDIEKTKFFQAVRMDTIFGTFALPSWGGNRGYAGWHLLEFEHQPSFQPPFGYYDADANANSGKDPR